MIIALCRTTGVLLVVVFSVLALGCTVQREEQATDPYVLPSSPPPRQRVVVPQGF